MSTSSEMPRPARIATPISQVRPIATAASTSPAAIDATSFAPTTRHRRGVKTNVGRIVPKRYSLVTTSTPASAAKMVAIPPIAS